MLPFRILTFDCYGTLIDWERGMREALAELIEARGLSLSVDDLLREYGAMERELEREPYQSYRDILRAGLKRVFGGHGVRLTETESNIFADTLPSWPKFPDTTEVLSQLKAKGYRLVILSNVDDELVCHSIQVIGVEFDGVITAEQVRSYKPAPGHWEVMLETFGVKKRDVLHVAQSYFHDVVPAKAMGYTMAWINRNGEAPGGSARPDHGFPDLRGLLTVL